MCAIYAATAAHPAALWGGVVSESRIDIHTYVVYMYVCMHKSTWRLSRLGIKISCQYNTYTAVILRMITAVIEFYQWKRHKQLLQLIRNAQSSWESARYIVNLFMYVCMYVCMYLCIWIKFLDLNNTYTTPMYVHKKLWGTNCDYCVYVCKYVYLKGWGSIRVLVRLRLDRLNS